MGSLRVEMPSLSCAQIARQSGADRVQHLISPTVHRTLFCRNLLQRTTRSIHGQLEVCWSNAFAAALQPDLVIAQTSSVLPREIFVTRDPVVIRNGIDVLHADRHREQPECLQQEISWTHPLEVFRKIAVQLEYPVGPPALQASNEQRELGITRQRK